jgi:2-C-methyl-D-erythritol 4-phosphate cytidylyltransferase
MVAMSTWAIVVAAGSGRRFGGEVPKQFLPLGERRVLDWALRGARDATDGVVLVVGPGSVDARGVSDSTRGDPGVDVGPGPATGGADEADEADASASDADPNGIADAIVTGGAERSDSVRAGLAALPPDCDIVVVHDGARPLATGALYAAVIQAVREGADGAIPGVAVTDTIKQVCDGQVVATPDRAELVAVQTPQAFRTDALRQAHAGGGVATDDAALVESLGGRVVVVPGEADNMKITRPADLAAAEAVVVRRRDG